MAQPRTKLDLPPAPGAERPQSAYPALLVSAGSWFGSWGMQTVLFAWLVTGELRADPAWVGTAQMSQTLPALLLLLLGGAAGDRFDRRGVLLAVHCVAALTAFAMSQVVATGALVFGLLIVYGVAWGTLQAFALPSRDALLHEVAGADLLKAVIGMTLVQFLGQASGAFIAGGAERLGTVRALWIQSGVVLAGVLPLWWLPRSGRASGAAVVRTWREIADGVREVLRSPTLAPLAIAVACNGFFFIGPYLTLLPLMLRDIYGADIGEFGLMIMMFPLGAVTGSIVILMRGGIQRRGRALLIGLFAGGGCVAALALAPPFWMVFATVYAWGLCGSVFLNMSRTLFLQAAPASHRARVLSVYSLALMGMAPLSNLVSGVAAGFIGELLAFAGAGFAMMTAVLLLGRLSSISRMR